HQCRKILRFLHARTLAKFAPLRAGEIPDQPGGLVAFVTAVELGADLFRRADPVPNPKLTQPGRRALARSRPANPAMFELLWRNLGISGVEFAIEVDAEPARCVSRDGDVRPDFRVGFLLGHNGVVDVATDIDPEKSPGKVHIENTRCAKDSVVVINAGVEPY